MAEAAEDVGSTVYNEEEYDFPDEDVKSHQREIRKQQLTNKSNCKHCKEKETVQLIQPHYLVSVLSSIMNELITRLQVSSDYNELNTSRQALEVLQNCLQMLHSWIYHRMSTEEQLSLTHVLGECIVTCGSSLEELQSSPDVIEIVTLLLSLGQENAPEPTFSQGVFSLIASTFSSIISDGRMSLMHISIMTDILNDTVGKGVLRGIPMSHTLQGHPLDVLLLLMDKEVVGRSDDNAHTPRSSFPENTLQNIRKDIAKTASYTGFLRDEPSESNTEAHDEVEEVCNNFMLKLSIEDNNRKYISAATDLIPNKISSNEFSEMDANLHKTLHEQLSERPLYTTITCCKSNLKAQPQIEHDISASYTVIQQCTHTSPAQEMTERDMKPLQLEWNPNEAFKTVTASINDPVPLITHESKYSCLPPMYHYSSGETHQERESAVGSYEVPAEEKECNKTEETTCYSSHGFSNCGSVLDTLELVTLTSEQGRHKEDDAHETASEASDIEFPEASPTTSIADKLVSHLSTDKTATVPLATVTTQEYSSLATDNSYCSHSELESCQTTEHSSASSGDITLPESLHFTESEALNDNDDDCLPFDVHVETAVEESGSTSLVLFNSSLGVCMTEMGKVLEAVHKPIVPGLPDCSVSEEIESTHTLPEAQQVLSGQTKGSMPSDDYHSDSMGMTTKSTPQVCTETETTLHMHYGSAMHIIEDKTPLRPSSPNLPIKPMSLDESSYLCEEKKDTHTHEEVLFCIADEEKLLDDSQYTITTQPHECTEAHTDSMQVIATFEESIVVCIYLHQRVIKIILNKIQPILDFTVDNETDSTDFICEKLGQALSELQTYNSVQEVVLIFDNKANLLIPSLVCNLQAEWLDHFYFRMIIYPPETNEPGRPFAVDLPEGTSSCVVGDPQIPLVKVGGTVIRYPELPGARDEAEWVSYQLKCPPILNEKATKAAVMKKMQYAKLIHIATHSSGDEGYLAFAYTFSNGKFNLNDVLLTPNDIKELTFKETPVLVVLSSCASARPRFSGDGIEGITNAFLLAGAQAVISTFSNISDESSLALMKFFYQYLIGDGMTGMVALRKAMLSVRCFPEFSGIKHWSYYQYHGKNIGFYRDHFSSEKLCQRLGHSSVYPQIECLEQLKRVLLDSATLPTSIPVLHGCPQVKPSEPLIDFIHWYYKYFTGGIFWINCRTAETRDVSLNIFEQSVLSTNFITCPSLVVIDSPCKDFLNNCLCNLLMKTKVCIVFVTNDLNPLMEYLNFKIDRDIVPIAVHPLSREHAMNRLVHAAVKNRQHIPRVLETLVADCVDGDPEKVDVLCEVLKHPIMPTNTTARGVKDRIIIKCLNSVELKVLSLLVNMIADRKIIIDYDHVMKQIEHVKQDSRIVSCDIFNSLTTKRFLLPFPRTIIYYPEEDKGKTSQYDKVYIPAFVWPLLHS